MGSSRSAPASWARGPRCKRSIARSISRSAIQTTTAGRAARRRPGQRHPQPTEESTMAESIRFVDMMTRNDEERARMHQRIRELETALLDAGVATAITTGHTNSNSLTPEQEELQRLRDHVDDTVVDPIFLAVAADIAP